MANITTQTIRVDLSTNKVIPTAYTHQNDTARTLVFDMYNGGMPYTMTGNSVTFAYKSPIVNGQYSVIAGASMASGTVSGNKVSVTLPVAYTQISGVGMLTMIITPTSGTVRPVNIRLVVQKSADGDDTVLGASDWPTGLYDYMDEWLAENEPTEIANLKSDLSDVKDAVGISKFPVSATALSNGSSSGKTVITGITIKAGVQYTLSASINEATTKKAYIYIKDSGGTNLANGLPINIGATTATHNYTFNETYEGAYIVFALAVNDITISIELDSNEEKKNKIEKLEERVDAVRPYYNFERIESVIGVSHMGYHVTAPENTIPAFRMSKSQGFNMVECDVHFTGDSVPIPVLLHDTTINRTCCNASDGSAITDTIDVSSKTYSELLAYDACTPSKWNVYKGTKIPKFEDLLALCRELGLYIMVDCKALTDVDKIATLVSLLKQYDMLYSVCLMFNVITGAEAAATVDPCVYIGDYESGISDTYITRLSMLLNGSRKVLYAYTSSATKEQIDSCIQNGLTVAGVFTTGTDAQVKETIDNMDRRVRFVTANSVDATQYLYEKNIGDESTGLAI